MRKIVLTVLLIGNTTLHAAWKAEIAPYLWASGLDGTVQVADKKIKVSVPFSKLLKHLDFGAMLWVAAHQDRFGVFFNGLYSKVSDKQRIRNIGIGSTSTMIINAAGASYQVPLSYEGLYLEPYAGARYTSNDTEVHISRFHAKQNEQWTDAIAGTRVNYNITSNFNVEGAGDYGQGDHSDSYNLSFLAGYQSPNHFKNTRFYLGYRFLHQNYTHGKGIHFYQWHMNIAGPVAGALFQF